MTLIQGPVWCAGRAMNHNRPSFQWFIYINVCFFLWFYFVFYLSWVFSDYLLVQRDCEIYHWLRKMSTTIIMVCGLCICILGVIVRLNHIWVGIYSLFFLSIYFRGYVTSIRAFILFNTSILCCGFSFILRYIYIATDY